MTASAIYRYEVPVDDRWHLIELTGDILHVASRHPDVVEFWATAGAVPARARNFRVFGTGHALPDGPLIWRGTAIAANGALVWHLAEVVTP